MTAATGPLDLVGTWRLSRIVDDRVAGERLTVTGRTVLSAEDADRVRWREEGTLLRRGSSVEVSRTLFVVRRAAEAWWVVFEDGRDFHPWAPGEPVVHPCGADSYRGLVDTAGLPERWAVTWEVRGPGKDYTMVSELSGGGRA